MRRRSLELLATLLVAAVTALLLWVVMGPSAPSAGKAASPRAAAGRVDAAPAAAPAAKPAPLPPVARPADVAPAASAPAVPAPAAKGVLCSAAHEAAGLCKSHE